VQQEHERNDGLTLVVLVDEVEGGSKRLVNREERLLGVRHAVSLLPSARPVAGAFKPVDAYLAAIGREGRSQVPEAM
jgi:hypothetical protein